MLFDCDYFHGDDLSISEHNQIVVDKHGLSCKITELMFLEHIVVEIIYSHGMIPEYVYSLVLLAYLYGVERSPKHRQNLARFYR